VNDATSIVFFQVVANGAIVRIIDYYSNNNLGIDHYAHHLQSKPYRYGSHFAPHDIKVREWGNSAITRFEMAAQLGINFILLPQTAIIDGIESVWMNFSKFWIDETKCRSLVDSLENYRKEWNEIRQMYEPKAVKSWANHGADAVRYMCQALPQVGPGLTSDEFNRQKHMALYGNTNSLPGPFRYDPRYDGARRR
jgi:phage terminase large subunit